MMFDYIKGKVRADFDKQFDSELTRLYNKILADINRRPLSWMHRPRTNAIEQAITGVKLNLSTFTYLQAYILSSTLKRETAAILENWETRPVKEISDLTNKQMTEKSWPFVIGEMYVSKLYAMDIMEVQTLQISSMKAGTSFMFLGIITDGDCFNIEEQQREMYQSTYRRYKILYNAQTYEMQSEPRHMDQMFAKVVEKEEKEKV